MNREICGEKSFHFPSPPCLAHEQHTEQGLARVYSCPDSPASPVTLQINRDRMEEEKGKKKRKDTKKKESKNKLSAMNGEMDLAEAVGGGDAEETLRDQPTASTARNEAVTPRIHQSLWPTGQEKAENSFPSSPCLSFAPSFSAFPKSSGGLW